MNRITRLVSLAALITLAATAAATVGAGELATNTGGNENCCFTNPRYSGVCEVTTGPDETCSDVVAYLNNQESVGKTYCGNTTIRGGWAQVECEGEASMCTPPVSAETVSTE